MTTQITQYGMNLIARTLAGMDGGEKLDKFIFTTEAGYKIIIDVSESDFLSQNLFMWGDYLGVKGVLKCKIEASPVVYDNNGNTLVPRGTDTITDTIVLTNMGNSFLTSDDSVSIDYSKDTDISIGIAVFSDKTKDDILNEIGLKTAVTRLITRNNSPYSYSLTALLFGNEGFNLTYPAETAYYSWSAAAYYKNTDIYLHIDATTYTDRDYIYIGHTSKFAGLKFEDYFDFGFEYDILYEYWDGSSWKVITPISDTTAKLSVPGRVEWIPPVDWATKTISDISSDALYYVRVGRYGGSGTSGDSITTDKIKILEMDNKFTKKELDDPVWAAAGDVVTTTGLFPVAKLKSDYSGTLGEVAVAGGIGGMKSIDITPTVVTGCDINNGILRIDTSNPPPAYIVYMIDTNEDVDGVKTMYPGGGYVNPKVEGSEYVIDTGLSITGTVDVAYLPHEYELPADVEKVGCVKYSFPSLSMPSEVKEVYVEGTSTNIRVTEGSPNRNGWLFEFEATEKSNSIIIIGSLNMANTDVERKTVGAIVRGRPYAGDYAPYTWQEVYPTPTVIESSDDESVFIVNISVDDTVYIDDGKIKVAVYLKDVMNPKHDSELKAGWDWEKKTPYLYYSAKALYNDALTLGSLLVHNVKKAYGYNKKAEEYRKKGRSAAKDKAMKVKRFITGEKKQPRPKKKHVDKILKVIMAYCSGEVKSVKVPDEMWRVENGKIYFMTYNDMVPAPKLSVHEEQYYIPQSSGGTEKLGLKYRPFPEKSFVSIASGIYNTGNKAVSVSRIGKIIGYKYDDTGYANAPTKIVSGDTDDEVWFAEVNLSSAFLGSTDRTLTVKYVSFEDPTITITYIPKHFPPAGISKRTGRYGKVPIPADMAQTFAHTVEYVADEPPGWDNTSELDLYPDALPPGAVAMWMERSYIPYGWAELDMENLYVKITADWTKINNVNTGYHTHTAINPSGSAQPYNRVGVSAKDNVGNITVETAPTHAHGIPTANIASTIYETSQPPPSFYVRFIKKLYHGPDPANIILLFNPARGNPSETLFSVYNNHDGRLPAGKKYFPGLEFGSATHTHTVIVSGTASVTDNSITANVNSGIGNVVTLPEHGHTFSGNGTTDEQDNLPQRYILGAIKLLVDTSSLPVNTLALYIGDEAGLNGTNWEKWGSVVSDGYLYIDSTDTSLFVADTGHSHSFTVSRETRGSNRTAQVEVDPEGTVVLENHTHQFTVGGTTTGDYITLPHRTMTIIRRKSAT